MGDGRWESHPRNMRHEGLGKQKGHLIGCTCESLEKWRRRHEGKVGLKFSDRGSRGALRLHPMQQEIHGKKMGKAARAGGEVCKQNIHKTNKKNPLNQVKLLLGLLCVELRG